MLEFPEVLQQAISYLKTVLPVLRKLGLAPNPLNYALWYVHASGRRPELSATLEKIERGLIPYDETTAEKLFRQHICLNNIDAIEKAAATFELLTATLHDHLKQGIDSSERLDENILCSRNSLQNASEADDIRAVVAQIVTQLDAFNDTNREYRRAMLSANAQIEQLRLELERAQQSANIDELTRLFNRATFYRELNLKIESKSFTHNLCVVLCDLDYFKAVNDRLGHLAGDHVLQRVSNLLLTKSREGTIAARYGGEEFALILPGTDLKAAKLFAERLRLAIHRLRIQLREAETIERLTASFGVACLREGDTAESLFERADKALYLAKEAGRNTTMTEASIQ
ncbi:MAG: GGDEF domain-containing protein [Spongiibacteraceae bacterium]